MKCVTFSFASKPEHHSLPKRNAMLGPASLPISSSDTLVSRGIHLLVLLRNSKAPPLKFPISGSRHFPYIDGRYQIEATGTPPDLPDRLQTSTRYQPARIRDPL